VIPRNAKSDKDVTWIQSPPFFQFHTMNAFEDGNRIEVTFPWNIFE
jgi:carotenoid cleavage dioxygenase